MAQRHGAAAPQEFVLGVKSQEGLQEILLRPKTQVPINKLAGTIMRQENVVYVDENSSTEPRQNFKVFPDHSSANGDHVTGIEEQDVPFAERLKQFEVYFLYRFAKQQRVIVEICDDEGLKGR